MNKKLAVSKGCSPDKSIIEPRRTAAEEAILCSETGFSGHGVRGFKEVG